MNKIMNIPTQIEQIQEADIPEMVAKSLSEANPLYPVPKLMDKKDMEAMYRELMVK